MLCQKRKQSNSDLENQIHIPVGYDIFNFEFKKIIEHKLLLQLHIYDRIKIIDWHNAE